MPSVSLASTRSYVRRSRRKLGNRVALPSLINSGNLDEMLYYNW